LLNKFKGGKEALNKSPSLLINIEMSIVTKLSSTWWGINN